jgi:hypothetical protein
VHVNLCLLAYKELLCVAARVWHDTIHIDMRESSCTAVRPPNMQTPRYRYRRHGCLPSSLDGDSDC